ncbi:heparinase II/III family protein [bacterium]|nr:heparinase II/III family protein [bacterium]
MAHKRFILLLLVTVMGAVVFLSCARESFSDMIGTALRDNFETGELNSWESYPYAEDPGFDPDIVCVSEPSYGNSAFSLTRILEPNDTDYPRDRNLLGMTRKCRIRTNSGTEIGLAVFLDADRKAREIRIILCAADGRRFTRTEKNPPSMQWIPIRRTPGDFTSGSETLQPGVEIEAVAVLAEFGTVSPHRSYAIHIDNFELTGETERRFIGVDPATTFFDKFRLTALNRHFHRGETISLSVRPEQGDHPINLKSVTAVVYDSGGRACTRDSRLYDDGSHGDRAGSDGVWSSGALYRIGNNDPAGRWKLVIRGSGSNGETVEDEFFFIVPERRLTPGDHPRLFFTADSVDSLKSGRTSPMAEKALDHAVAAAKKQLLGADISGVVEGKSVNLEFLDGGPFSTTWDDYSRWSVPGYLAADTVENGAFLYALTGDREAGMKAKEFLLRFAAFEHWNHPWFDAHRMYSYYPVGLWCQGLAVGYDFLYPLMNEQERALVRKALLEKAIIPHYRDQVLNNRLPSLITNHIGMNTTGILLATIALIGDDPENPDMEPYLSGILTRYKAHIDAAYLPDGSYAEPETYTSTDAEPLVKCLAAIERNLGIDWTTTTPVKSVYTYTAYALTANGLNAPSFGDGGRDYGAGLRRLHLWLARRTGDSLAWGRYLWQNDRFPGREDFFDYLWMPEKIEPRPFSELPPSQWFRSKGNAVFRSGWTDDDLMLVFRCGPHANHYHLDQGSFWFLYNGEPLITEAGVVNYYRNLYYRSFYIQPIAHNTVLLDAYPESQQIADFDNGIGALDTFPRITSCFTGEIIDAVEGELSCVYKERLKEFNRSFVFMKPDYIVMYDNLAAVGNETFTWIFHADGAGSITGNGNEVVISRPRTQLRMNILAPADLTRMTKKHVDQDMSFVQLGTRNPAAGARFLAVLIPSDQENAAERSGWTMKKVTENGWIGTEIVRAHHTDRILFRTGPGGETVPAGEFETDGDRFAVTGKDDGTVEKLWVRNAATVKEKRATVARTLLESDIKLTISIAYRDREVAIESDAGSAAQLAVWIGKKPGSVLLNGAKTRFSYDGSDGLLHVPVPQGHLFLIVR